MELGIVLTITWWATGLVIISLNLAVLWGIFRSQKLRTAHDIFMANVATSDLLTGIGVLYRVESQAEEDKVDSRKISSTVLMYSQVMCAAALALMSLNSYIAVRYPIFFQSHIHHAKRNAVLAVISPWLVLSLFVFSPSMGWNCIDTPAPGCTSFFYPAYFGILGTVILFLAGIMLFCTISLFVIIKRREKRRLELQHNSSGQNQPHNKAAQRQYKERVYKAGTVMIHVVVAFVFWLFPIAFSFVCLSVHECAASIWLLMLFLVMTWNSAINPVASIVRMPELRKGLWQSVMAIPGAFVAMRGGNNVDAKDGPGNASQKSVTDRIDQNILEPESTTVYSVTVRQGGVSPRMASPKPKSSNLPMVVD
ncbi:PREDICTED: G-protein coupled receptor 6-like [Branchiostoma belcheri]|uniref:G-protein coupled receptor 6-like n=1 Tax=Branchiostoma belcheri TaxID=7741 RepID=A0A6P4XVZ0_BRABE|nr:PREDICTED: G-protein coupled receptor 6-like [Branchiostoma belcheri]